MKKGLLFIILATVLTGVCAAQSQTKQQLPHPVTISKPAQLQKPVAPALNGKPVKPTSPTNPTQKPVLPKQPALPNIPAQANDQK